MRSCMSVATVDPHTRHNHLDARSRDGLFDAPCGTLVLMRPRAWRVLALAIGSACVWALLVPALDHAAAQDRTGRRGGGSGAARAEKTENEREADPDAPDTSDSARRLDGFNCAISRKVLSWKMT